MDNLTHALVGAAFSKSGVERITPLATATLVLAANAPDVDVLSYTQGQWFALSFRRGLTHGIPALIVLPWLVAGIMTAWDVGVRRRGHPDRLPTRFSILLAISYLPERAPSHNVYGPKTRREFFDLLAQRGGFPA